MPFSVLDERIRDSEAVGVQLRTEGVRVQRFKKEAMHPEEDEMVPGEGVDAEPGLSAADRRETKETVEGGSTLDWPEAEWLCGKSLASCPRGCRFKSGLGSALLVVGDREGGAITPSCLSPGDPGGQPGLFPPLLGYRSPAFLRCQCTSRLHPGPPQKVTSTDNRNRNHDVEFLIGV
ncbi:hypothetical protein MHYP_G00243540 [Metynnis hypsauchen]